MGKPPASRGGLAAALVALRARLGEERGSLLIEVMVGAVVLAVATVAIFNGLDGAQRTGATNKARSVQATLAQQDIERMRAMPVTALSNYSQTRTVPMAGVSYTVVSRTDWVRDASGVVSCSSDEAPADYLKLTTSVTSPSRVNAPVTQTALLTPAVGQLGQKMGTATVRLTDRDGQPVVGANVTLSGPSSASERTNALGCAVFGFIPAGTYTATVPTYVDFTSELSANEPLDVYAGRASFSGMQVERPAGLRASFVAPSGHTNPTPLVWDVITVNNVNLPGGFKRFTRTSPSTSIDATELFPFTNGVSVFAGSCPANDPSRYRSNYFQTSGRGFTALEPGSALGAVSVEMPTLRVTVTRQPVSTVVPAWFRTQLLITSLDSGCPTVAHQITTPDRATNVNTDVTFDVAVPFGRYRVCAATRGRTSGLSGSTGSTTVNRSYTTTGTATTNPTNPEDPNLTTIPAIPDRPLKIITRTSSSTLCF